MIRLGPVSYTHRDGYKRQDNNNTYYAGAHVGDIWGFQTIGIAKTDQEMTDHLAGMPNGAQDAVSYTHLDVYKRQSLYSFSESHLLI